MQAGSNQNKKLIAWNGIRISVPNSWDSRVSGGQQLIFERDFLPLLQIRWQKADRSSQKSFKSSASKFVAQLGLIVPEKKIPRQFQPLKNKFSEVRFFQSKQGQLSGGICLCPDCPTILLFQLLVADSGSFQDVIDCLATFSCHDHTDTLWRIQDFSLITPDSFTLHNYSFAAGLTRISFSGAKILLQTCRIGPADKRLEEQSLTDLLITLTGCPELHLTDMGQGSSVGGERTPTIFGQIIVRLRREKPFISARIWQDSGNNRILAVILTANHPIPHDTLKNICKTYEII